MTRGNTAIDLVGAEFALVNAAAFLLANWNFEHSRARFIAESIDPKAARSTYEHVSEEWIATLLGAGLWKEGDASYWTEAVMKRRAQVTGTLTLSYSDMTVIQRALTATQAEFSHSWNELVLVAPGNLDSYGVGLQELDQLAAKFNLVLATAESDDMT